MTPLTQQLEDKKKGCGKNLGAYMEVPKEYENAPDKIRKERSFSVEVICGKQEYCKTCQAEITILEQAIAEIEKQRQEILEKIEARCKGYFDKEYWHDYPAEPFNIIKELKQQLNQPKEEGKG